MLIQPRVDIPALDSSRAGEQICTLLFLLHFFDEREVLYAFPARPRLVIYFTFAHGNAPLTRHNAVISCLANL